jgi:hypothetical protein
VSAAVARVLSEIEQRTGGDTGCYKADWRAAALARSRARRLGQVEHGAAPGAATHAKAGQRRLWKRTARSGTHPAGGETVIVRRRKEGYGL